MTVVFVHGLAETSEIWKPLREMLDRDSVAPALPGFGAPRPHGFSGTKDEYAGWLADMLTEVGKPVDIVGHDLGALLTMRLVSAFNVPVRSWVVDVAPIFHPRFTWPDRVRRLQTLGVGEEMLKISREASPDNSESMVSRLRGHGVPSELAVVIGSAHDEAMSRSVLDFYRSAIPNVAADWWKDLKGPIKSRGMVLLLPDPPELEAMSMEVAHRLGAETARLNDLNHCWMAEAPEKVAPVLERFWSSLSQ
jgi:pimeloyl-ACP methyl ester carboxylesterase